MVATKTSVRIDARLADEAMKILEVRSRTEAVRVALRQILSLRRPTVKKRT